MNSNLDTIKENNDISPNEVVASRFACLSLLLTPLVPLFLILLSTDQNGDVPYWVNFFPFVGSVFGLLVCYLIFAKHKTIVNAATNRIKDALKLSVVSTTAIGFIFLIFAGSFDGPEGMLPGMCLLPFVYFVPIIGLIMAFSPFPKSKEQNQQ